MLSGTLIGHSRGASIATLFASVAGDRCDRLVLLDGLLFPGRDNVNAATQLSGFVGVASSIVRVANVISNRSKRSSLRSRYGFSADNGRLFAPRFGKGPMAITPL